MSYSGFERSASSVRRGLDAGELDAASPAPHVGRLRRAIAFRRASLAAPLATSAILVIASCFVWLGPR